MHAVIVPLAACDRERIESHLLRLSVEDRSRRFAAGTVSDHAVRRYVASIDFGRDHVLGLVSKLGQVFGLAHGAAFGAAGRRQVEVAFSVDAAWRGRGLGTRLMDDLLSRVAADGDALVVGQCALRNLPMRRLFEHGGMALTRDADAINARRELLHRAPPTLPPRSAACSPHAR